MRVVSTVLTVVAVCFISAACDTGPPPEVKSSINYSDNFAHRQMVASFNALPSDNDVDSYRYFHPSGLEEDRVRMVINFFEMLSNTSVKYLSIGCDRSNVCDDILESTLDHALMEKLYRDDMTLMLPEYLEPPYKKLDKLGIKVFIYNIPGLNSGDLID